MGYKLFGIDNLYITWYYVFINYILSNRIVTDDSGKTLVNVKLTYSERIGVPF